MNRGQLILAAGAVIAIALIAVLLAILQLGYHPSATTEETYTPPEETRRVVEQVLVEAEPVARDFVWVNRSDAAVEIRQMVSERLTALNGTRAHAFRRVEFAPSVAAERAAQTCPRGPGQRFGPCAAIDGILVQKRGESTHLIGVFLRIHVTHGGGSSALTILVRPLPRVVEIQTENAGRSGESAAMRGVIKSLHSVYLH